MTFPPTPVWRYSGWGQKVATDAFRGYDDEKQHYPGFHVEAAQMLIEDIGAMSIASDIIFGSRHFGRFRHPLRMVAHGPFRD